MKISYGGYFEIQHGGTVKQSMQNSVLPLDFLPPENIHLDIRIKSIAAIVPELLENEDFIRRLF